MNREREDDLLARSISALRRDQTVAETTGPHGVDDDKRAREHLWLHIAADVRRARAVRRWAAIGVLQVALALGGTTVWATVTGRLQPALRSVAAAVHGLVSASPHVRRTASPRAVNPVRPPESGQGVAPRVPAPALVPVAEAPKASPPLPPVAPARHVARAAEVSGPAEAAAARPDPVAMDHRDARETERAVEAGALLALYRQAHRQHFVDRDYPAALESWNRYLAAGPGPLALEARYNRAIALAHLRRREEAIEALRPFADGAWGAYRRQEASQLVETLRRRAAPGTADP